MKYSVVLAESARQDLFAIFKYIAVNLQSVQAAAGQFSRIERAIMSLERLPERYRLYDKEVWRGRNLRVMPVDHYLVFYVTAQETLTVTVLRVMYGGRDIDKQLDQIL